MDSDRTLDKVVFQGYGEVDHEPLVIVFRFSSGISSSEDIEGDFVQQEPLLEFLISVSSKIEDLPDQFDSPLALAWDIDNEIIKSMKYGYNAVDDEMKRFPWCGSILLDEGFPTYLAFEDRDEGYHTIERTVRVT